MTDKYRQPDATIFVHPASGNTLRLDPALVDGDTHKAAKKSDWQEYTPPEDGFRDRRKRSKADMKRLIAEGIVADPAVGPQPHQTYGPEVFVIDVPLGRLGAAGNKTGE